jgi:glycosyltransferase involved in cell wall biosynthesis
MAGKIAIVVQRYGRDVLGGSEALAADIAACLSGAYDVEVLTTCAMKYETWANHFRAGESEEDGIRIRRFAVDSPRHPLFTPVNVLLRHIPHTTGMEKRWMRMQGPYSSGLTHYIAENREAYDAFVFVTYLYGTTYYCLPLVKDRSILVPTAHDEPFIRYSIFREVFAGAERIIYLTGEEKTFTDRLFSLDPARGVVAGAPIKEIGSSAAAFRSKYGIEGDFILYAGRLDRMKGVHTLMDYFERYCRESHSDLKLVLCGKGPMQIDESPNVIVPGYVPAEDMYSAMAAARATVVPSKFESFSYTLLESLLNGTPALVNGECSVLRGHCERSGACLCYDSYDTFKMALDRVLDEEGLRERMGEAGRRYVLENYSLDAVGKKYITAIDGLINQRQEKQGSS